MKKELVVSIVKMTVLGYVCLCGSVMASDQWAMHQANPAHTGYVPITINPNDIALRWKKSLDSSALSPVTVAQDQIYVSVSGYLGVQFIYAIKKDGSLAWGKSFTNIFSVNPPSYANGRVYVQTGNNEGDTYLRAYDAKSGNFIFQSPFGAQWERYMSPTIYKGNVYINGGTYGGMYSFTGVSGKENWFFGELPQVDGWTPAVDEKWAYAYTGTLYVVDRLTGKLAFSIINSGSAAVVPMLGGSNDVFVVDGGMLSKFNTATKKIAWQKTYDFNEGYAGQPALANNVLYTGTTQGSLVALDQATGKTLWSWKNTTKAEVVNNVVATKSHVFFSTKNKIYAIDTSSHKNVWSYNVSGYLALGESGLYVSGSDGNLTAFNLGLADIFTPLAVFFPQTAVNATSTRKLAITNVGNKTLSISAITSTNPVFLVSSSTAFTLEPEQSTNVEINFEPKSIGVKVTNLVITSNDGNEPKSFVRLEGKGF